jgi:hypothetical protein
MKQLKYFLFVAALTLSFMGCQKAIEVSFDKASQEIDAEGGSFELMLKSNGDWTINPDKEWVSITPMSGKGNATLTIIVEANTTGDIRMAEVKATTKDNTAVLTLTQSKAVEYINVTPKEIECNSEGGEFTVELSTNIDWFVAAPEWIACSPAEGSGNATITMTIYPISGEYSGNRETDVFLGNLSVLEKVHVVQSVEPAPGPGPDPGPEPNPHFLEVSPIAFAFGKEGGEMDITISCDTTWEFDLDCSWLSLSQQSGMGDATVTLTALPNEISEPRALEFHIKSYDLFYNLTATQAAGEIIPAVSFTADTVYAAYVGGLQHVELNSNTDWALQVSDSWISLIPPTMGNGNASFDIIIDSNADPEGRTGLLKALHAGQVMATLVVVQEGKPNILETDLTTLEVRPEGGDYVIQVTANQEWTVANNETWLRCNPQGGFANGSFTINVDPLPSPRPRTGYVKVSGSTGAQVMITVNQH